MRSSSGARTLRRPRRRSRRPEPGPKPGPAAASGGEGRAAADAASAGDPRAVQGTRVTIRTPEAVHWQLRGELLEVTPQAFRVRPDGGGAPVSVSRATVERFRVSEGRRRSWGRGAFVGLFVGFIVGEAIVASDRADGELDPDCGEQSCRGWGTRLAWTAVGIGAGGLVGSRFHHERWRDVPPPAATAPSGPSGASRGAAEAPAPPVQDPPE